MPPSNEAKGQLRVLIVTGPAGSGRSSVIRALEDLGFEAIDNLPLPLLGRLIGGPTAGSPAAGSAASRPLVIGVDPRTRGFGVAALEAEIAAQNAAITLVYVDCAPSVLVRRFNETRRRHPSAPDAEPLVGIEREMAMLAPLKTRADVLIDTTAMTPHDLRTEVGRLFATAEQGGGQAGLVVTLRSFSVKRGLPLGADMVVDVRFLRNPYWDEGLRPLDGRDPRVAGHVAEDPRFAPFTARLEDMLGFLLPAYATEGKAYFTVGIGCTGGRHRSVAVVERLAKALARAGWRVSIRHRDLVDGAGAAAPVAREGVGAK